MGTIVAFLGLLAVPAWAVPKWSRQRTPNPGGGRNVVLAGLSCPSITSCTAVGYYDNRFGTATLAEGWNGTAWSIETTPKIPGTAYDHLYGVSCISNTACIAVGLYNINRTGATVTLAEVWDGTSWRVQTTPNPAGATTSALRGVSCSSATACTAVGYSVSSNNLSTLAEAWDGTAWSIQTTPNPVGSTYSELNGGVSCSTATACTAVGTYFNNGSSTYLTLAERWDGTAWSIETTPNRSGSATSALAAVSCSSATACNAVGYAGSGTEFWVTWAATWDGTAWTNRKVPEPSNYSFLYGVSCSSATACTAVGSSKSFAGTVTTLAEAWDGTAWSIQTTPNPAGAPTSELLAVSCGSATACTAVGDYVNTSGTQLTLAEAGP